MNRQQRRAAQAQGQDVVMINVQGRSCTAEEARVMAVEEYGRGNLQAALDIFRLMTAKIPAYADGHYSQGYMLQTMGRKDEALVCYGKAIALNPAHTEAHNNRGAILQEMKRYEEALASYDKAVALDPNHYFAWNNRGDTLLNLKRYEEALKSCTTSAAIKPDNAGSYNNLGNILRKMQRLEEGLANYDKAIALNPGYIDAHINRGVILQEMKRHEDALASYDQALVLDPNNTGAYLNRSEPLRSLRRHEEALASCDKAIALSADNANAYNNRAGILQEMRRFGEALASYDKAIALDPDYTEAYSNRGALHQEETRYEAALADFEKALALKPDFRFLLGTVIYTKLHICSWQGINALFEKLAQRIEAGEPASLPFHSFAAPLSTAQKRKCAEILVENKYPPSATPLWKGEKYVHDRIRIGYFSSDLRHHALSYLLAEFFELHDRSKFEVTAFSFAPPVEDSMRVRLKNAFEHFIDVHDKSDRQVAALARSMEIDIAVDLNGFTHGSRTNIFTMRPAPAQMSYMGFPGSMGAPFIDYLMADGVVVPEEHNPYYSEKIVRLPYTYWAIDSTRARAEKGFTRKEMGLPEEGFVFCCFNNTYKITPDVFDIWMRLLHKVPGSVLWLLKGNDDVTKNLLAQAKTRGIEEHRLVFADRVQPSDHLTRQRLADLFLDTFYYNAHTTTSDALWEGLPVLTCLGETFTGRVAASLLKAAHLPELITHSRADYEMLALELAMNPQKLSAVRGKLLQNQASCPLFNTKQFTRYFENAFEQMHARTLAGLPPEHIYVPA